MDRKAWLVVILCIIGIVLNFIWVQKDAKERAKYVAEQEVKISKEKKVAGNSARKALGGRGKEVSSLTKSNEDEFARNNGKRGEGRNTKKTSNSKFIEKLLTLENDFIKVIFTNSGGGIRSAILKTHSINSENDTPIEINKDGQGPIGGIFDVNSEQFYIQDFEGSMDGGDSVVFVGENDDLRLTKKYKLVGEYQISLEIVVEQKRNNVNFSNLGLYTGAMSAINPSEDKYQILYFYGNEDKFKDIPPRKFDGSSWKFWKKKETLSEYKVLSDAVNFSGVSNQFFTSFVFSEKSSKGTAWSTRYEVSLKNKNGESEKFWGMEGMMPFNVENKNYSIYIGPKSIEKFSNISSSLNGITNYGFVGFISRPLLKFLNVIAKFVHNYGVAIVIVTIIIRFLIWPLHQKSMKSMKKMALLNPKISELREKYKDQPAKVNQEMMALYRDYGVNPISGCLPMLLQLPIFIGFYYMLRSAVELRQEQFLWVKDLSLPDTIGYIGSIPINPLPILMAVTMIVQMMITPKTGDSNQQKIFMFMPVIFLFICYNFASALSLYWTTSNIFSVFQTWITNRMPQPKLVRVNRSASKKSGGFMSRLAEQAEAQKKAREQKTRNGQGKSGPGTKKKNRPPRTGG